MGQRAKIYLRGFTVAVYEILQSASNYGNYFFKNNFIINYFLAAKLIKIQVNKYWILQINIIGS